MKPKIKRRVLVNSKFTMSLSKTRLISKNIPHIYLILTALAINVVLIIATILLSSKLPPQTPLYYGLPRGERQLSAPTSLILPLALSSLFIAVNSIIANFSKNQFLKNTLIAASLFSSLLSVVTVVKIILLTISFK